LNDFERLLVNDQQELREMIIVNIIGYMRIIGLLYIVFSLPCVTQDKNVAYETIAISCFDFQKAEKTEIVILSQFEYDKLNTARKLRDECDELPVIDFNNKVLIGYVLKIGGCDEPSYEIKINRIENKYTLNLKVRQNGLCGQLILKPIWVLFEKQYNESPEVFFEVH